MKKILLFCFVLALLLSIPAQASDDGCSTQFEALCRLPEISVIVPATAEVFINPYRLPVTIDADETTAQIVSTPAGIENKSEVPLSVSVTVTGAIKEDSDMALSSYSTQAPGLVSTKKRAFVYFEMKAATGSNQAEWEQEYDLEKHLVIRDGLSKTKKDMLIIAQADQPKHFGAFRLSGDCVYAPKQPWTEADGIEVEIVFTFRPLPVWTEIP